MTTEKKYIYDILLASNNNTSTKKQIIDDINEQPKTIFQKQLSVQDTIQKHFSQILKNDSIIVTDNTSITETLMMKENPNTSRKYNNQELTSVLRRVDRSSCSSHPTVGVCVRTIIHHFGCRIQDRIFSHLHD